jgi:hypothetical protein
MFTTRGSFPMSVKPSPETLCAVVMAVTVWGAIWGWYGFPRYIEAAFVLVLGCIGAFVWKKSRHEQCWAPSPDTPAQRQKPR